MSIDRSLKVTGGNATIRSVMTRPERIAKMISEKKLDKDKGAALGIPKTRIPKK
jgi:small basic protein (TIGR04137 family)